MFQSPCRRDYEFACEAFDELWKIYLAYKHDLHDNQKWLHYKFNVLQRYKQQLINLGINEIDATLLFSTRFSNEIDILYDNQKLYHNCHVIEEALESHYHHLLNLLRICVFQEFKSLPIELHDNIHSFLIDESYTRRIRVNICYHFRFNPFSFLSISILPKCHLNFLATIEENSSDLTTSDVVKIMKDYEHSIGFYPIQYPSKYSVSIKNLVAIHRCFSAITTITTTTTAPITTTNR